MRQLTTLLEIGYRIGGHKIGRDYHDVITIDKQVRKKMSVKDDSDVLRDWSRYVGHVRKMMGNWKIKPGVMLRLKMDKKNSLLMKALMELGLLKESKASDQAKKLGLDYMKFGRYGKNGTVTHVIKGDKLVPTSAKDAEPQGSDAKDTGTEKPDTSFKPDTKTPDGGQEQPQKKIPNIFHKPKLADLMPNAKIATKSLMSKVTPDEQRKISVILDKLLDMTKDAIERGEKAPNYNLCKVHVPGTNLFCGGNLGVPRLKMPQFKGTTRSGSIADKLPKDEKGQVDADELFLKHLQKSGVKVLGGTVPADRLKSTQNQLIGPKIAGMAKVLEKDPKHKFLTAPIYISRDGYILDGHHRWGANVAVSMRTGKPMRMKVNIIDKDIKDLLPLANKFADKIGINQAGA